MVSNVLQALEISGLALVIRTVINDFIPAFRAVKPGVPALTVGRLVNHRVLALTLGKLKVEAVLCLIEYQQALVVVSVFGNKVELATLAVLEDLLQVIS